MLVVVAGVSGILIFANLILSIWDRLKPKPSVENQLHTFRRECGKEYATKLELIAAVTEWRQQLEISRQDRHHEATVLREEMKDMRKTIDQGFGDLRRSLGRVEGKLENGK